MGKRTLLVTIWEIMLKTPSKTGKKRGKRTMIKKKKKRFPHGYPQNNPNTINKAIDILKIVLTKKQKRDMIEDKKEYLNLSYIFLCMWIRSNFGLWGNNDDLMQETGCWHPDDASWVIVEKLLEELKSKGG